MCCAVLSCTALCCAVLYCAVLCCTALCCAVLCCIALCCALMCHAVPLCCAVLYCAVTVLCCVVLCYAVLYCAMLCCTVLCCAVLCCVVLYCAVLCCALMCHAVPSFVTGRKTSKHNVHSPSQTKQCPYLLAMRVELTEAENPFAPVLSSDLNLTNKYRLLEYRSCGTVSPQNRPISSEVELLPSLNSTKSQEHGSSSLHFLTLNSRNLNFIR